MGSGPALMGGAAEIPGLIGGAVGVATTGCVKAVGACVTWAASAGGAAAACADSKAGAAGTPALLIGPANGGDAEWTGLVAALEIASALADIGAPVWLPELKLWARSPGVRAVGVWVAPMGLPAAAAVVVACASRMGVALVAELVELPTIGTLPASLAPPLRVELVATAAEFEATALVLAGIAAGAALTGGAELALVAMVGAPVEGVPVAGTLFVVGTALLFGAVVGGAKDAGVLPAKGAELVFEPVTAVSVGAVVLGGAEFALVIALLGCVALAFVGA